MESPKQTEGEDKRKEEFGMVLPTNENIRRVSFNDLEAVMAINDDVYEGLDYLPSLFYTFLHSKQHEMYVYERDGKVISLVNYLFLSGREGEAHLMSGRIHPSHQNQGLRKWAKTFLEKAYPEVVKYSTSTLYTPYLQNKVNNFESVSIMNLLLYKLSDRNQIERFVQRRWRLDGFSNPITISHSKLTNLLDSNSSDQLLRFISRYNRHFIPLGPTGHPVGLNAEGLRLISSLANVLVTYSAKKSVASLHEETSSSSSAAAAIEPSHLRGRADGERQVVGFSCSTVTPCKYGSRSDLVFYGDDVDDLIGHFVSDLRHHLSITRDDVSIAYFLQFPQSISVQKVEEKLSEELGTRVRNEYYSVAQLIHYCTKFAQAKL